jgi:hypothetical protein
MIAPFSVQKVRRLATPFSPEAIAVVQQIRGAGSLQAIEVKVSPGEPGPAVRIAFAGQWEPIPESQGEGGAR